MPIKTFIHNVNTDFIANIFNKCIYTLLSFAVKGPTLIGFCTRVIRHRFFCNALSKDEKAAPSAGELGDRFTLNNSNTKHRHVSIFGLQQGNRTICCSKINTWLWSGVKMNKNGCSPV